MYIQKKDGSWDYRIPAWMHRVTQTSSPIFDGVFWNPPENHVWRNTSPPRPTDLRIYEAHVGMSSSEPKVASYRSFAQDVLPQIKDLGYNCLQLMAIMEHAYYASFGYQVTKTRTPLFGNFG